MFEHGMRERNKNVVVIEDIGYHELKEMLRYIHTGTVDDLKIEASMAADKYDV